MRKLVLYALAAAFVFGAGALIVDLATTSDAEQLEAVLDALVAPDEGDRADALLRFTDLSREPVRIRNRTYDSSDDFALMRAMQNALGELGSDDLEVIQRSVHVNGDRGTVAARLRSGEGPRNVTIHVVRSGQGWLISRIQA